MVTWEEASKDVINIAQDLVEKFHPDLKLARIGFVFRSEAQISNGKEAVGQASKVSDKLKPMLELDFLIWIAKDVYERLDDARRRAVIDHELTHITWGQNGLTLRYHDIEEFHSIIERYGLWCHDLVKTKESIERAEQLHLEGLENGLIKALDGATLEKVGGSLE